MGFDVYCAAVVSYTNLNARLRIRDNSYLNVAYHTPGGIFR